MQEMNSLSRELPVSCYEVIRLPTKSPPSKGSCDQQPATKRQKVVPAVTGQADKFRSKVGAKYPSFTKTLLKSNVSESFLMGIPQSFCTTHLPKFDTCLVLENKPGKEYEVNYLAQKAAFGEGWREFSLGEKLFEGEVLVFQLVNQTKFKVQRIRKNGLSEVNGDRVTLKTDATVEQNDVATLDHNKETRQASSLEAASGDEGRVVIWSEAENVQKGMSSVNSQTDEFLSNLESKKYPSFNKTLVKSHVSGSFWMGLPQPFCRKHLPSVDTLFILEYENGKQYKVKYLAEKVALSGGWRGFSLAEKLSEGDVIVFQLVNSTKFKLYKKRSGFNNVNGNLVAPSSDARVEQSDVNTLEQNKETHRAPSSEIVSGNENHVVICSDDESLQEVETDKKNTLEFDSGHDKHDPSSPVVNDHNDITNFDDFNILLDELLQKDYKLQYHIKWSYFQLCSSRKSILHVNLSKDINPVLVAGCIIETVDISNAMKSCELAAFNTNFATWDRKLKSLELLGMNVRFLSARLLHLQTIACNSEVAKKRQQYMDLCSEHADCQNMIKSLQDKLDELRRFSEKCADDMEKLKTEIKEHELRFREQVSALW